MNARTMVSQTTLQNHGVVRGDKGFRKGRSMMKFKPAWNGEGKVFVGYDKLGARPASDESHDAIPRGETRHGRTYFFHDPSVFET